MTTSKTFWRALSLSAALSVAAADVSAQCTLSERSFANATVNVPYTQLLTPGGGKGPYTITFDPKFPPPSGITLVKDLRDSWSLAGTTRDSGTTTLGLVVADGGRICATQTLNFSLTVCPVIGIAMTGATSTPAGSLYTATFQSTAGTTMTMAGSIPGLTFTGLTLTGRPTDINTFTFTITASLAGCSASRTFTLTVTCPAITIGSTTIPSATTGLAYPGHLLESSGGSGTYTYAISAGSLPPGLTLNRDRIEGTPTRAGTFPFEIEVTDSKGCKGGAKLSMVVNCPLIVVTPAQLPGATLDKIYSVTFGVKGGTPSYALEAIGTLPPGLTLKEATLGGTPAATGTFTFSIKATDANGCSGATAYTLIVEKAACPQVTISPASLPNAKQGSSYAATFAATGASPLTWSSSALPDGLSFTGGTLSGTPARAGIFSFTIIATDANQCSGSQAYTLVIDPPACPTISISPALLPGGKVGTVYKGGFVAAGGAAPYAYSTAGTIPPGLTIDGNAIGGTPVSEGKFTFTVTARDASGCSGSKEYTIVVESADAVCKPISILPSILGPAKVNVGFKAGLSASGGAAPYSFSLVLGTLPPGLSLFDDVISGTPLKDGTYTFTLRALDSLRCEGTAAYAMVIEPEKMPCPAGVASPNEPADGAQFDGSKPINFSWSAVAGASSYDLLTSTDGGATFNVAASTSSTTTAVSLNAGNFVWAVRANLGLDCQPTTSLTRRFNVAASLSCPTGTAVPLAPANGATGVGNSVIFEWRSAPNATAYSLLLAVNGGSPQKVATTTDTTLKLQVPDGLIAWAVATSFDRCPATISPAFTFSTVQGLTNCPPNPQPPTLIAPADGAQGVTSPVLFSWNAVPGASEYRLLASVNGERTEVLGTTRETRLEARFGVSVVVWQVEAIFDGCASTLSGKRAFVVTSGSICNPTAPVPVSPANGAGAVLSPVTFTWSPSSGAVSYRLYLSIDGKPFELAETTRETTHTQVLSAPARVAWQIEALFLGCDPARSSVSNFTLVESKTCPQGTITLLSPAAGASVTSPVTFSWTGIAGATDYRVWASVDGSALDAVAKSTTTTVTAALASGEVKWYVEAIFGADCRPINSSPGTFKVQAADNCGTNQPPAIQSPLGSEAQPVDVSSPVELRWSPVTGAEAYRVWLSVDGKPAGDLTLTKETAVRPTLGAGTYAWFVEALFPGCRPLPSTRGFFRVARTEPRCSTDAPTLIAPSDGATNLPAVVTFLWTDVAEAIGYRLYAQFTGAELKTDFILIGETKETSSTRPFPPGDFVWYVETVFQSCPSTSSAHARFNVARAENCSTQGPGLISPRDGSENVPSPVELSWSPVSGAAKYVVIAKSAVGAPTPIGEVTAETSITRHMPAGASIEWWVIAFRLGCEPIESERGFFTVAASQICDVRPPTQKSPPDNTVVTNPVQLEWTEVTGARGYRVWAIFGSERPVLIATPIGTQASATFPTGRVEWYVEATFESCSPIRSSAGIFEVAPPPQACRTPDQPFIGVVGQTLSGTPYSVRWSPLGSVGGYELQESDSAFNFTTAETTVVQGAAGHAFEYATETPIRKFYRVRGISSCSDERGPYSEVVGIHIVPSNTFQQQIPGTAEVGLQRMAVQTVSIPGSTPPISFTARTDKPWLTVSPTSGVNGPDGTTFTLTADPGVLALGANMGTLILSYGSAGKGAAAGGAPPTNVPVSISLVTPVSPAGKNTPPADALIIPAVGHAPGANNSLFQSDVRVANTSTQPITYQLNFTPSGTDGTLTGSSTTIQVEAGGTAALNDILASFFGTGPGGSALGVLEIRTLSSSNNSSSVTSSLATATIASSRTYNVTQSGTLGQYVPAVAFSKFVGKAAGTTRSILSMQQVAENAKNRTNLGLVEGSGQPAELMITVFDVDGRPLGQMPESLKAFEHKQINAIIGRFGIQLDDGRIEVEVISSTGKVTAYASRVDNQTNDPLLVQPIVKSAIQSTRYVVPGVAYIDGLAKWRSDVRIFNAGASSTAATVTYFPQGNPAAKMSKDVTLDGGQILALDNVLHNFFGINESNAGGSLLVTTPTTSSIVATARTYAETDNGTYGLFAPGVTPNEAVAVGQRSLHLLQLEHSSEYRTNVGLVETTGNPATVEVSLVLPDSKATGRVTINLPADGFVQFPLSKFAAGDAIYNARVAVKVISGAGRVSAYGSVVDNRTNDSTYVPAQ